MVWWSPEWFIFPIDVFFKTSSLWLQPDTRGSPVFQHQFGGLFQVSHPYLTVLTTSPIRPQFADGSTPLPGLGRLSGHARGRGPVSPSLILPGVPAECHARSVLPARSCRRLLPPDIWTPPHQPECSEDTTDPKGFIIVQCLTLVYKF